MNAKKLICDAMYTKKCAKADSVLAKIKDLENMSSEKLRKFLAPLKIKQVKAIPRTKDDLLICYCQWIHVEKRDRIVIDGEEQLNAVNLTDCADKSISDGAADELISTAINAGDFTGFAEDSAIY